MPEGPEARAAAKQLQSLLVGKMLQDCSHLGPLKQIITVGKQLYFIFEDKRWLLNSSLGMTGHWLFHLEGIKISDKHKFYTLRWGSQLEPLATDEHGQVTSQMLVLDTVVYYHDVRGFGKITWLTYAEACKKMKDFKRDWMQHLVPQDYVIEIPSYVTDPPTMDVICAGNKLICEVLLDQKVSSGIGNYIRCEALYLADIHPFSTANKIPEHKRQDLYQAICHVMLEAYKHNGLTLGDFLTPDHSLGAYKPVVYDRTTTADGYEVVKLPIDGRNVHVCLETQLLYE